MVLGAVMDDANFQPFRMRVNQHQVHTTKKKDRQNPSGHGSKVVQATPISDAKELEIVGFVDSLNMIAQKTQLPW